MLSLFVALDSKKKEKRGKIKKKCPVFPFCKCGRDSRTLIHFLCILFSKRKGSPFICKVSQQPTVRTLLRFTRRRECSTDTAWSYFVQTDVSIKQNKKKSKEKGSSRALRLLSCLLGTVHVLNHYNLQLRRQSITKYIFVCLPRRPNLLTCRWLAPGSRSALLLPMGSAAAGAYRRPSGRRWVPTNSSPPASLRPAPVASKLRNALCPSSPRMPLGLPQQREGLAALGTLWGRGAAAAPPRRSSHS